MAEDFTRYAAWRHQEVPPPKRSRTNASAPRPLVPIFVFIDRDGGDIREVRDLVISLSSEFVVRCDPHDTTVLMKWLDYRLLPLQRILWRLGGAYAFYQALHA